ncbi:MAG: glycosyltransferase family 4 protein [Halioglobus sp.]
MKIGFMIGPTIAGRQNGVVSQAITWKNGICSLGSNVDLINPWNSQNWGSFDVVHIFGLGACLEMIPALKAAGVKKIVLSPIYDAVHSDISIGLLSLLNFPLINLKTSWAIVKSSIDHIDLIMCRSTFEKDRLKSIYGIEESKMKIVRLPVRFSERPSDCSDRSIDVLHVSILNSKNKNVKRLINAAIKFGFDLTLAGNITSAEFSKYLDDITGKNANIRYKGLVTDDELINLYNCCRVFALPSTFEGVGLVALEAAFHGADIVLTENGAPKEYYKGMARLVDPLSVNDIGSAIRNALSGHTFQPDLADHIAVNHSSERSARDLLLAYEAA